MIVFFLFWSDLVSFKQKGGIVETQTRVINSAQTNEPVEQGNKIINCSPDSNEK